MTRQRTEFPDFVAHQFRTSIVAIKGSAATVLGSPYPMDHRETRQFLQIIDEHADHMRHLIGNLSDQRDMETGTLSVHPEPADLGALVEQARVAFLRRGGANTVIVRSGPALPMAKLDRERIFRALGILLTHGFRKFSPVVRHQGEPFGDESRRHGDSGNIRPVRRRLGPRG